MEYVVCETGSSFLLHLRHGVWQKCGHQDSLTLCERKAAWDTRIPVDAVLHPQPEDHCCKVCIAKYQEENS